MEILITGGNGFLGKAILEELVQKNTLKVLSRTAGEYQLSLEKEIPDFDQKFDLVIHAAGKAHSVPTTAIEKKQFHQVNVVGTQNLLKGLERSAIPEQFVFISTVAVYGIGIGTNITENFPLNAKDAYGMSKIEAEKNVLGWCQKNNVICTILRLPLLVGPNPPGNLGAMIRAINKGYYFNVGGGLAKKSMVLIKDVARFIPVVSKVGGVFNLTDGYHPSFKELSSAISRFKNKKKPYNLPLIVARAIGLVGEVLGERSPVNSLKIKKITSDLTFDDSKVRNLLNWKSQPVLEYLKTKLI